MEIPRSVISSDIDVDSPIVIEEELDDNNKTGEITVVSTLITCGSEMSLP